MLKYCLLSYAWSVCSCVRFWQRNKNSNAPEIASEKGSEIVDLSLSRWAYKHRKKGNRWHIFRLEWAVINGGCISRVSSTFTAVCVIQKWLNWGKLRMSDDAWVEIHLLAESRIFEQGSRMNMKRTHLFVKIILRYHCQHPNLLSHPTLYDICFLLILLQQI